MADRTATGVRCPQCSAALRPGAPWCTQCYAAVGAPAPPATVPEQAPVREGGVRVAERAGGAPSGGCWPCTSCGQPNELAEAACSGCGTPFLAAVRGQRPTVVLPVVGDVLALSPVRRVGLAVGVVVAFLLLNALLALLLV